MRFDTVLEGPGLAGLLNKLFAARLPRPMHADVLERLERDAQSQTAAVWSGS